MAWQLINQVQVIKDTWSYSSPVPASSHIRVGHILSHPLYLQWFGWIANVVEDGDDRLFSNVRKLWPVQNDELIMLPAIEFGGVRRIAVRGGSRQPYNVNWTVLLHYWDGWESEPIDRSLHDIQTAVRALIESQQSLSLALAALSGSIDSVSSAEKATIDAILAPGSNALTDVMGLDLP